MAAYTELQVCSNYSFLRGASRIEELMLQAKALGYEALAVTDHNTLAGIARAHARAKEVGIRLVAGCRLELTDGLPVLAYPRDRAAYARLCRLLTLAKSRGEKGTFELRWTDLAEAGEGLLLVLLPDMPDGDLAAELRRMRAAFAGRCHLALSLRRRPGDELRLRELADMAQRARVPTVVTGDVLYHAPQRRILQDVVTCIREGCTIDDAGYRRERFADRHLKSPEEMARLFAAYPEALARSSEIAASCTFSLAELSYQYPDELQRDDETPQQGLERLVQESLPLRFPDGLPPGVAAQLAHELRLIGSLGYAPYFLTVNSIVRFARGKGILCQGRGSAANSAVCYVLASPRSTRCAPACCSNGSSPRSATSRRTSTSTSRASGARRSSSGSTSATAATAPPCAPPSCASARAAPYATWARCWASQKTSPARSPPRSGAGPRTAWRASTPPS